jgi:hypothetical protein
MFKDTVRVLDSGFARLRTKAGAIIAGRSWDDLALSDEPVIAVKGWVNLVMRERGKIVPGSRREGHNVWTNTGKEYLALLMSISAAPSVGFRSDHIGYIGVGTGSQLEDPAVLALAQPVAFSSGVFLAALDIPPSFPLLPTRTTVRYHRTFAETEITLTPASQVNISEIGLFTDGNPASAYAPGTRLTSLAAASAQAPNAYKTFEPVGKTDGLELDVSWEIRF